MFHLSPAVFLLLLEKKEQLACPHAEFAGFGDILSVIFILPLPPPRHPPYPPPPTHTVYCQHDDLWPSGPTNHSSTFPEDERFVSAGPRKGIWSAAFRCIPKNLLMPLTFCFFLIFTCCIWRVRKFLLFFVFFPNVFEMWILLCNAAGLSVLSKMLQWFREEENIQTDVLLAGHDSCEFAVGVRGSGGASDSVQCYEVQKHAHQGEGPEGCFRGSKVQSAWSEDMFFFSCLTATAGAPCSQACCPERRGVCCSRGRCCPGPGSCWSRPRRPGRWWRRTACSPDGWSDAHPRPRTRRPSGSARPRPSRPGRAETRRANFTAAKNNINLNWLGMEATEWTFYNHHFTSKNIS